MAARRDIEEEQAFLDRAYRALDAMRRDAGDMLDSVLDLGRGGTFQSRTERDIVVRTSLARLAQLDIGDQALSFGRIDRQVGGESGDGAGERGDDAGERGDDAGERGDDAGERGDDAGERGDDAGEIESFHIGRLAVSGESLEPLVVDWRAPVAEPFYRATGLDPQGLTRRRHLAVRRRTVVGVEDEYFAGPGRPPDGGGSSGDGGGSSADGGGSSGDGGGGDELALGGPGALLAAIGQARTGHMGDIVATIQREQDQIIRSPMPGLLMVQGGPGTGKTAVALHRAAYLLYTHRFPLERQGVLVVGPNPLFLRYIEQVLPSLGETGVTLSTVAGMVPDLRVSGVDAPRAARLKGDVRMVRVIARAVRTRQRPLRRAVFVPFGGTTLQLTTDASADVVARARRRAGTHNARRRYVEHQVTRLLADQYERYRRASDQVADLPELDLPELDLPRADLPEPDPVAGVPEPDPVAGVPELDLAAFGRDLRRIPAVAEALDRMWPRLSPLELIHDLFGAPALIAAASRGVLTDEEQAWLHRPRSATLADVPWTVDDAALVDEARLLLGPRRPARARSRGRHLERAERAREEIGFWPVGLDTEPRSSGHRSASVGGSAAAVGGPAAAGGGPAWNGDHDDVRSYGHIVVDEVQDLSVLQLRMLARRSISGSMTVVGDIAQATGAWAPAGWDEVAEHLAPGRTPRLVELTVSYRTPAEVVDVASGVLAVAAPGVSPPRPVRRSGHRPTFVTVHPSDLAGRVADQAAQELAAVAPGRTAVLVPPVLRDEIFSALEDRGLDPVDPRRSSGRGLDALLVVLPAGEANGLEFDSVVVVEPALVVRGDGSEVGERVVGDGPSTTTRRGLRTLYVALTRPTRRLAVVSSLPPPAGLGPEGPAPSAVTRMLASGGGGRVGNTP
ncbi:MAG: HelD family protein [Acidimicrobiales bacterium]